MNLEKLQQTYASVGVELHADDLSVLSISEYVHQQLMHWPDQFASLVEQGLRCVQFDLADWQRLVGKAVESSLEKTMMLSELRRLRHQALVTLTLQTYARTIRVLPTLTLLSDIADTLINAALKMARQLVPQGEHLPLYVIAMGKLGGHELNFSSDIDLVFVTDIAADDALMSTAIKVMQQFVGLLNTTTADGFVYRVDTRLRPYGNSGQPVVSVKALDRYFYQQGREWERFAWSKARLVSGQHKTLDDVIRRFVYRRYLDYAAFSEVRRLKQMIMASVDRHEGHYHLKLGRGGIREIEFIAQVWQITRGGRDPNLQQRATLTSLAQLHDVIPEVAIRQLTQAYQWLRNVENQIQMLADQQTHTLPQGDALQRLAKGLGLSPDDVIQQTQDYQQQVIRIFDTTTAFTTVLPDYRDWLSSTAAEPYQHGLQRLQQFVAKRKVSAAARQRMNQVIEYLFQTQPTISVWDRWIVLLEALAQRSAYLQLLIDQPEVLERTVSLFEQSPWIAGYITRHPVVLDTLLQIKRQFQQADKTNWQQQLQHGFDHADYEQQLNQLRDFQQRQLFQIAVMDILYDLPLMQVSDLLTVLAEVLLTAAVQLATQLMQQRYGHLSQPADEQLGVIGFGKLGGQELNYESDLDVVFVRFDSLQEDSSGGERGQTNSDTYYTRLAQQVMQIMMTVTTSGRLYEIDTRLRPNGQSGNLVPSLAAFERYYANKAWVWEYQALVRARMVVGPAELLQAFDTTRQRLLSQIKVTEVMLKQEVASMKQRMQDELSLASSRQQQYLMDVKLDSGGLVDIEFICQFGVLAYARQYATLLRWTDTIRLLSVLMQTGVIQRDQHDKLRTAYLQLRAKMHRYALSTVQQEGPSRLIDLSELDACEQQQIRTDVDAVQQVWQQVMAADR